MRFSHTLIPALGLLSAALTSALQAQGVNNTALEEITVTGTDQSRYRANATSSLSGMELDFLSLPRVVDIIPEQVLLDQKVTELEEALRNVPGVSYGDGFGGSNNDYLIRGFRRNTVYRNGLRVLSNFRVNTSNLERVEVVKGPASITYGQVEPGGLVDIVTKKPLDEGRSYLEARAGSYDSRFLLADWSQPLGERVAIRVNASSEQSDTFRDFFEIDRKAIAVSGRVELGDMTMLSADYEYRDEFRSFDRGTVTVPVPGGREIVHTLLGLDPSTRFGEPFEEIDTEFEFASIRVDHAFNDNWAASLMLAMESSFANDYQARPLAVFVFDEAAPITPDGYFTGAAQPEAVFDEAGDQVFLSRRSDGSRERDIRGDYARAQLNGAFEVGPLRHRVVAGLDYRGSDETRFFVASAATDGIPVSEGGTGPLLNLKHPIYGNLEKEISTEGLTPITAETDDFGIFFNDYIEIGERFGLLLGARYDSSDPDGGGPAEEVGELSPQMAVNYRLYDNISLFASYAEAFEPNTAFVLDEQGNPSGTEVYDPEDSTQYELGTKAQFFDGRLNFTAAIYDIQKSNVLTVLDDRPQLVDGQQARGGELSLSGQPLPGVNITAGYAFTDAEVLTGGNSGNRPQNVAEHTANLWASYEFQEGSLSGLGTGIGAFYLGDRYGDNANSWKLGRYTLFDASMWYTVNMSLVNRDSALRLQLAVKNLTDEEYFPASGADLRINIGTPRTIMASASLSF